MLSLWIYYQTPSQSCTQSGNLVKKKRERKKERFKEKNMIVWKNRCGFRVYCYIVTFNPYPTVTLRRNSLFFSSTSQTSSFMVAKSFLSKVCTPRDGQTSRRFIFYLSFFNVQMVFLPSIDDVDFFFIYEIFSFKFGKNLLSLIKIDNKKDIILDMTYIFNIPISNFQNFNLRFCMHIPGMQKFG